MSRENRKIYDCYKNRITDVDLLSDYERAQSMGKIKAGEKAIFYKNGLKQYAVPYVDIDRAFKRVRECKAKMCCAASNFDYYSLVLMRQGQELVEISFGEYEDSLLAAERFLKEKHPEIAFGYVKAE